MKSRTCWLALLPAFAVSTAAMAQGYPVKPVRVVLPFSPGGAADVPGRIILNKMSTIMGQQFVVENRPGAGATIGAEAVARSAPDGYTLLFASNTHVISASLYKKLSYDALQDFAPIMEIGAAPNVLIVHPALPAKTVKELIALAKARPDQIDYASSGNGSSQHLFAALFTAMAGIRMNHIPYKGSAMATTDLVSGQVQVSVPGINNVIQHIKAGRLRALGVTSAKRSRYLPEVPTIAEAGVPGYEATLWLGLLAPKGTPAPIIDRLHGSVLKVLQDPDVQSRVAATGTEIGPTDPEKFAAFLRAEYAKWAKVIQQTGANVN
jgi:tripartite-type tricarboxylate transporter receptor subunit TctC